MDEDPLSDYDLDYIWSTSVNFMCSTSRHLVLTSAPSRSRHFFNTSKLSVVQLVLSSESTHMLPWSLASSRDCPNVLRVLQSGSERSVEGAGWPTRDEIIRPRRRNTIIFTNLFEVYEMEAQLWQILNDYQTTYGYYA